MKGYIKNVGLFDRHTFPESVKDFIFDHNVNPVDVATVTSLATSKIRALAEDGVVGINLYTTGLTIALIATLNAAARIGMEVKLWHYCKRGDTGDQYFFPQEVYLGKEPQLMTLSDSEKELQKVAALQGFENKRKEEDLKCPTQNLKKVLQEVPRSPKLKRALRMEMKKAKKKNSSTSNWE